MNKDAEILNGLLNRAGVKGFSFIYEDNYLSIRIPRSNDMLEYYYFICIILQSVFMVALHSIYFV